MFSKLIKINAMISEGNGKVQWIFNVALWSGIVAYGLNLIHLAIFGVLAPIIAIIVFYLIGRAHKAS